jgi:hypothetical protein
VRSSQGDVRWNKSITCPIWAGYQTACTSERRDAWPAITVIHLQRRSLGGMLGHALDHQLWEYAHLCSQVSEPDAKG